MSRVKYKASVLKNMSQAEIVLVASIILEEALLVPADKLLEEGIDAEDIAILRDLKNDFNDIQSEPKEAIIDRSESTEKLSALFSEANSIVKNSLDKLAIQYKRKAPEFYRRYRIARGMASTKQSTAQKPVTEPEPVR